MLASDFFLERVDKSDSTKEVLTFERVYVEWFHEVARWVRANGGLSADVDDLTQEVFLVVRRKLKDFDGAHLKAWLYRITKRTVRDYRRRAWFRRLVRRRDEAPDELERLDVERGPDPSQTLEQREALAELQTLLDRLTERRRRAFVLFEIEGYSGEEIASLEGIPVNTVWSRLYHARRDFMALADEAAQRRGDP